MNITINLYNTVEEEDYGDIKDNHTEPSLPLCRIIKEGSGGCCNNCGSSTIKKFGWFGKDMGCIQPECENYYKPNKIIKISQRKFKKLVKNHTLEEIYKLLIK